MITASIALMLGVIGTVIWGSKAGQTGTPPPRTVPNVNGQDVQTATRTLEHADLNITVQGTGHATSQNPAAGAQAYYGDYVTVTFQ